MIQTIKQTWVGVAFSVTTVAAAAFGCRSQLPNIMFKISY